jgi:ribosomal protein L44E
MASMTGHGTTSMLASRKSYRRARPSSMSRKTRRWRRRSYGYCSQAERVIQPLQRERPTARGVVKPSSTVNTSVVYPWERSRRPWSLGNPTRAHTTWGRRTRIDSSSKAAMRLW